MRKYFIVLLLVPLLFITACGSEEPTKVTEVSEGDGVGSNNEDAKENVEESAEDGKLTEVGQKIKDPQTRSTVELLAVKEVNETIDLDPLKLIIDDIKIIRVSDIKDNEFKSYISQFTDKEEFEYIQIMYSIENTEDENIELIFPIKYIVLDTGEQIEVMMNDIMLDPNNGGDFFGKVTKETGVSVVIESSIAEDISSIKLITGDVWEIDGDRVTGKIEKEFDI